MEFRKLGDSIGVEVTDVDVTAIGDADFARIYQAWLDGSVLVIRGQDLGIEDYLAWSERFGRVKPHLVRRSWHPDHPKLMLMDNVVADNRVKDQTIDTDVLRTRGGGWHSDLSYEDPPAKATQLYSKIIPTSGGDTLFASSYAAYDALPEALKARIAGMNAGYRYGGRSGGQVELLEPEDRDRPLAVHPLVRVHPETGRKALYFNTHLLIRIMDVDAAEGEDLIAELSDYIVQPGHQYRHPWQLGDLLLWDNRCVVHKATGDYPPGERRLMWRVTIMDYDWRDERLSA